MIIGCAQWGGDNPLGITGGSYGGYGQDNDINLQNPTNSNTLDPALLGEWINNISGSEYQTWTFNANGTLKILHYSDNTYYIATGTYFISNDSITINLDDEVMTGTYLIRSNRLTITFGLVTMRFVRTQLK